jgi:uncharacterized membrane protein YsdA (DUF1294 family)/cold shock CspA family protein
MRAPRPRITWPHSPARDRGVVATWNDQRGYGFLQPDDGGPLVFVHCTAVPKGSRRPYEGQALSYELETDDSGKLHVVRAEQVLIDERAEPVPAPTSVVVGICSIAAFVTLFLVIHWVWHGPLIVAVYYLALSILTFGLYYLDKQAAQTGRWRVRESTLVLVGLIGGWPGAVVAQQVLRHKTIKLSFRTRFWFSVILNVGVFASLAWYFSLNPIPGFTLP